MLLVLTPTHRKSFLAQIEGPVVETDGPDLEISVREGRKEEKSEVGKKKQGREFRVGP